MEHQIVIIFGTNIPDTIGHAMTIQVLTSGFVGLLEGLQKSFRRIWLKFFK